MKSLSFNSAPQAAAGYMIFQGDYYSFITTRARDKFISGMGSKPVEQLTDAEKLLYVQAFRNMTAAAGSFTIEGDQIVYVMEVVRTPSLNDQKEKRKSRFENGHLVQDFMGGGQRQVYVWERVSSSSKDENR